MNFLAEQTGGHAFYNTNALEEALEKASTEGSSYYSMVYAPTNMKYDGSVRRISVHLEHGQYQLAYRRSYIADEDSSAAHKHSAYQNAASSDQAPATMDSMAAASQFGAPLSHQLVFAAHVDAYGAPVPATAEQMAALAPYSEQVAKAEHRKFVQSATPVPMRQYVIEYAVLASQMELPKSANGFYQSDLSMAALAFNKDGDTLVGTKMRLKDDIPASKIENIRKDGFQAIQTFFVPAETAAIRLVVRDEHSGRSDRWRFACRCRRVSRRAQARNDCDLSTSPVPASNTGTKCHSRVKDVVRQSVELPDESMARTCKR